MWVALPFPQGWVHVQNPGHTILSVKCLGISSFRTSVYFICWGFFVFFLMEISHSLYLWVNRPHLEGVQTSPGRWERVQEESVLKYAYSPSRKKREGKEALSGRIQMCVLQVKEKEKYVSWAFSPTAFFRDLEDKSRISLNMNTFKLNTTV